jgi:DNA-binding GntR family transcriptional regulator
MVGTAAESVRIRGIEPVSRPTVADQVFETLHSQILALELPPGTRLSEVHVAGQLGVSRQPVRDAFYRLSKLGFLSIRPQRATTVSQISGVAVLQARFIRLAIEAETVRTACARLTAADHAALDALLDRQRAAVAAREPKTFHTLDDQFHREICDRAGCGFAWALIRENKSHMDRVRFLSLSFASEEAFGDHVLVLEAIKDRDEDRAVERMRLHLDRIKDQITRIRAEHQAYFLKEE